MSIKVRRADLDATILGSEQQQQQQQQQLQQQPEEEKEVEEEESSSGLFGFPNPITALQNSVKNLFGKIPIIG